MTPPPGLVKLICPGCGAAGLPARAQVAHLGWIARLLTRAVPALTVAGLGWIARLLTRAVPALTVAGLPSAT